MYWYFTKEKAILPFMLLVRVGLVSGQLGLHLGVEQYPPPPEVPVPRPSGFLQRGPWKGFFVHLFGDMLRICRVNEGCAPPPLPAPHPPRVPGPHTLLSARPFYSVAHLGGRAPATPHMERPRRLCGRWAVPIESSPP